MMANAAGIESIANAMSANTIAARQTKSGVACRCQNQWCPWYSGVTGNTRRTSLTMKFEKFLKLDTNDPNSPFGNLGGVLQGDPLSSFDAFDAGLEEATYVGAEEVDGEEMDHYVLTVDAEKAAKAQGTQLPSGTGTVTYDLWIDDQDLMRRLEFGSGAEGMTMTLSDWGKPVTVKAPPASALMELPGSMGG